MDWAGVMGLTIDVDNFKVDPIDEIGRGAYGTVFRAKDQNGITVAAKKIEDISAKKITDIESDINFYRSLGLNDHPNILKMLHTAHEASSLWTFTEYCVYGDLDNFFRSHYQLVAGISDKVELMRQISCGIDFLHGKNIAHRDIKPGNILVSKEEQSNQIRIKLCDFGMAKHLDETRESSGMNSRTGTSTFRGPEFWLTSTAGPVRYYRSVDIFAAGVTFLAILQAVEGRPLKPYLENCLNEATERDNPIGLVMVLRYNKNQPSVNPVSDYPGDDPMTSGVKQLIRKMTVFMPGDRPTAHICLHTLQQLSNKTVTQVRLTVFKKELLCP